MSILFSTLKQDLKASIWLAEFIKSLLGSMRNLSPPQALRFFAQRRVTGDEAQATKEGCCSIKRGCRFILPAFLSAQFSSRERRQGTRQMWDEVGNSLLLKWCPQDSVLCKFTTENACHWKENEKILFPGDTGTNTCFLSCSFVIRSCSWLVFLRLLGVADSRSLGCS